jgi:hypothetical protein
LACPYFMPTQRLAGGEWPHPARLPLGVGWQGLCTATAAPTGAVPVNAAGANALPTPEELRDHCNLGYAHCAHLPAVRYADAVRFSVAASSHARVVLNYVCERDHHPGEHGTLDFDVSGRRWATTHPDARVQRMAECYLESHIERNGHKSEP